MIVFAIIATIAGLAWTFVVFGANAMRSSPGEFEGKYMLAATWFAVGVFWLAWWVG